MNTQRSTPNDEKPFCWQSKVALRQIRDAFDASHTVTSAMSVYVALTEIASDEQCETFDAAQAYIGMKSGLSSKTVGNLLPKLARIGLVAIKANTVNGMDAKATYRLLSAQQPLPSGTKPLPTAQQPLPTARKRTKKAPVPTLEESKEESYEKSHEDMCSLSRAHAPSGFDDEPFYVPSPDEVRAYAEPREFNSDAVNHFLEARSRDNWHIKKRDGRVERVRDWRAFLESYCLDVYEADRRHEIRPTQIIPPGGDDDVPF